MEERQAGDTRSAVAAGPVQLHRGYKRRGWLECYLQDEGVFYFILREDYRCFTIYIEIILERKRENELRRFLRLGGLFVFFACLSRLVILERISNKVIKSTLLTNGTIYLSVVLQLKFRIGRFEVHQPSLSWDVSVWPWKSSTRLMKIKRLFSRMSEKSWNT